MWKFKYTNIRFSHHCEYIYMSDVQHQVQRDNDENNYNNSRNQQSQQQHWKFARKNCRLTASAPLKRGILKTSNFVWTNQESINNIHDDNSVPGGAGTRSYSWKSRCFSSWETHGPLTLTVHWRSWHDCGFPTMHVSCLTHVACQTVTQRSIACTYVLKL